MITSAFSDSDDETEKTPPKRWKGKERAFFSEDSGDHTTNAPSLEVLYPIYHSPSSKEIHLRALRSAEYCSYPPKRARSVYLSTAEKQNPRFDKRPLPKGANRITWKQYVLDAERSRLVHETSVVAKLAKLPSPEGSAEYSASSQSERPKEKSGHKPFMAAPLSKPSSSHVHAHLDKGSPPAIFRWLEESHVPTTHSSVFDSIWIEPPVSARSTKDERQELRRLWKIRASTQRQLLRPGLSFPNDPSEESTRAQILAQEMFAKRTQVKSAGVIGDRKTGKKPSKFVDFCWQRKARIETMREQAVVDTFMGRDRGWDEGRMVLP